MRRRIWLFFGAVPRLPSATSLWDGTNTLWDGTNTLSDS